MKQNRPRPLIILFLAGMLAVNAIVLWYGRNFIFRGYGDFAALYTAGKLLDRGQGPDLYLRSAQWKVQQEFASNVEVRKGPLPYIRPPFEALLFAPFARFNYPTACALWMVFNVLILFCIPPLLAFNARSQLGIPFWLLGPLCLAFTPVAVSLLNGQDAILLLFIFCLALHIFQRGHSYLAGAVLALGLIKFHLTIPFILVLLFRKKIKVVAGFLFAAFGLILISIAITGWPRALDYPRYLWRLNGMVGAGMVTTVSMPNFRGALTVLLGNRPLPVHANLFLIPIVMIGIFVAASGWRDSKGIPALFCISYSFAIVVTLLCSYYAYGYDLTLLLLPFLLFSDQFLNLHGWHWPKLLFVISAIILFCSPLIWAIFFGLARFYWLILPMFALALSLYWCLAWSNQSKVLVFDGR